MIPLTYKKIADPESDNWEAHMAQLGQQMANDKVRFVLFVHGTFVGDDPLGIISIFSSVQKVLAKEFVDAETLGLFTKKMADKLNQDTGNFTQENVSLFKQGIKQNIECQRFIWSSGNYHIARLQGAVELAQQLAMKIESGNFSTKDRILLIGHSHAGQLFALLTELLENTDQAQKLIAVIDKAKNIDSKELQLNLKTIAGVFLDIVIFGTPVRYRWGGHNKYRLINIINDRNNNVEVDISGVLQTRDGDYVQQLATEGTDTRSPESGIRELNKELDEILANKGQLSLSGLTAKLDNKSRHDPLLPESVAVKETFLVDYQDQTHGLPNCIDTLFGHGVYTQKKTLLFNTDLIVNRFYASGKKL